MRRFASLSLVRSLFLSLPLLCPRFASAVTYTVTTPVDSGPGSLRSAIINANASPVQDTIQFQIPPVGSLATIQPLGPLPQIQKPVIIDGTSQTGSACPPGIELDGTFAGAANGLWLSRSNCVIRGLVINRFQLSGILIMDNAGQHLVEGCYIGTDISGASGQGNGMHGISIAGTPKSQVGQGTGCGQRNIISGNGGSGVWIQGGKSVSNRVENNYLGTDVTGLLPIPNGMDGITISGSQSNTVGAMSSRPSNLISGNATNGVRITGEFATDNLVFANYIGTAVNGTAALPNGRDGVRVENAARDNVIGADQYPYGNTISGNGMNGIALVDGAFGNRVAANMIGSDASGVNGLGNEEHGVLLDAGATNNVIGGQGAASGNLIVANGSNAFFHGVAILEGSDYTVLQRNLVGLTPAGSALGNAGHGVWVQNAHQTSIGGADWTQGNVISGNGTPASTNGGFGVWLGTNANYNTLTFNLIGTDTNGTAAVPNLLGGVAVFYCGWNQVGKSGVGEPKRNVISGNGGSGVWLYHFGDGFTNDVESNYIGVDITGLSTLGNVGHGVHLYSFRNSVKNNVISGNASNGLAMRYSYYTTIQGNVIGLDASETVVVSNRLNGVRVYSTRYSTFQENVIGGNGSSGFFLEGSRGPVEDNLISSNYIGVTPLGGPVGNHGDGILLSRSGDNTIEGNRIAYNGRYGVAVDTLSDGNAVLGNGLHHNGDLGIDLDADGVTSNDVLDADAGENNFQNFPALYSATTGSVLMGGMLHSAPSTEYRVELFLNNDVDASGYGEGEIFLGYTDVQTDAEGNAEFFDLMLQGGAQTGQWITATATDPDGNTSEFSLAIPVVDNESYDGDGDGMPNQWEERNGLSPNVNTGDHGANGDPDSDGIPNSGEHDADTDPFNSNSFLHVVSVSPGPEMQVTFHSTNTRYYCLQYLRPSRPGAFWIDFMPAKVEGTNTVTTITHTNSSWFGDCLYRVEAGTAP